MFLQTTFWRCLYKQKANYLAWASWQVHQEEYQECIDGGIGNHNDLSYFQSIPSHEKFGCQSFVLNTSNIHDFKVHISN